MIAEYVVTGMTCEHCEHRVSQEIQALPGVTAVTADAASGRVHVQSADPLPRDLLERAVDEAGYELADA